MSQGLFLSLDGIDGAGKSTQCRLLADWLRSQGREVVQCADPGGTEIGAILRKLLLEHRGQMDVMCEALLFMASRAQLVAEIMRPALQKGGTVVSDRFFLANTVYQGYGSGVPLTLLRDLALRATSGLQPDLTIVLDLSAAEALKRRKASPDRFESRDSEFYNRVLLGFREEARLNPDRIVLVDASPATEQVQERIRAEVTRVLDTHPRS